MWIARVYIMCVCAQHTIVVAVVVVIFVADAVVVGWSYGEQHHLNVCARASVSSRCDQTSNVQNRVSHFYAAATVHTETTSQTVLFIFFFFFVYNCQFGKILFFLIRSTHGCLASWWPQEPLTEQKKIVCIFWLLFCFVIISLFFVRTKVFVCVLRIWHAVVHIRYRLNKYFSHQLIQMKYLLSAKITRLWFVSKLNWLCKYNWFSILLLHSLLFKSNVFSWKRHYRY